MFLNMLWVSLHTHASIPQQENSFSHLLLVGLLGMLLAQPPLLPQAQPSPPPCASSAAASGAGDFGGGDVEGDGGVDVDADADGG